MALSGQNLIEGNWHQGSGPAFFSVNPATGEQLETSFNEATASDVDAAAKAAWATFCEMSTIPAESRAILLDNIANGLDAIRAELIARTMQESALPQARIEGELSRTMGQLRLFAEEVRAGHWRGIRIDPAQPDRTPLPRPDLRMRCIPLGPVAVFGASNFPLAFSVAGGDTASALAAGCPVIVKAHPAHPGTSELVAGAIAKAVAETQLPAGMFSLLHGGYSIGQALVVHPRIKAVGFTGSRSGGKAMFDLAVARPEPIPVFAEMSSINPVLVFPNALRQRAQAIGEGLGASMAMGAGQFCTNPGVVFVINGDETSYNQFKSALVKTVETSPPQTMLTKGIAEAYAHGLDTIKTTAGVAQIATGKDGSRQAPSCAFETDAKTFAATPSLHDENFGASTIIVKCASAAEAMGLLETMEGQLTVTLQIDTEDEGQALPFIPLLERLAGRILVNGFPTGVEVSHTMVHGGPYPATSDSRSTSVGSLAIDRFLRPVCYQNLPEALLPSELTDGNPTGARRRIDGTYE